MAWLFWGPYPCVIQIQTLPLEGPRSLGVFESWTNVKLIANDLGACCSYDFCTGSILWNYHITNLDFNMQLWNMSITNQCLISCRCCYQAVLAELPSSQHGLQLTLLWWPHLWRRTAKCSASICSTAAIDPSNHGRDWRTFHPVDWNNQVHHWSRCWQHCPKGDQRSD